jgi:hypothetical protein
MLLFPFWVMAVAALILCGLVRLTQDRTTLSLVSCCFLGSAGAVLLVFAGYTEPVRYHVLGEFPVFELTPLSAIEGLLLVAASVVFVSRYGSGGTASRGVLAAQFVVLFGAMGVTGAADVVSIAVLLEVACISAFFLVGAAPTSAPWGFTRSLYFLPSVLMLLFAGVASVTTPDISMLSLGFWPSLLLAVALAPRLWLLPSATALVRALGSDRQTFPFLSVVISTATLATLMKLLDAGPAMSGIVAVLSGVATIWSVVTSYRAKELWTLVVRVYCGGTAALVLLAVLGLKTGLLTGADGLMLLAGQAVLGLGVLTCGGADKAEQSRFVGLSLACLAALLCGIPAVLALVRYTESVLEGGRGDWERTVALYPALANMLLLSCLGLRLPAILRESTGKTTPRHIKVPLLVIYGYVAIFAVTLPLLYCFFQRAGTYLNVP